MEMDGRSNNKVYENGTEGTMYEMVSYCKLMQGRIVALTTARQMWMLESKVNAIFWVKFFLFLIAFPAYFFF